MICHDQRKFQVEALSTRYLYMSFANALSKESCMHMLLLKEEWLRKALNANLRVFFSVTNGHQEKLDIVKMLWKDVTKHDFCNPSKSFCFKIMLMNLIQSILLCTQNNKPLRPESNFVFQSIIHIIVMPSHCVTAQEKNRSDGGDKCVQLGQYSPSFTIYFWKMWTCPIIIIIRVMTDIEKCMLYYHSY